MYNSLHLVLFHGFYKQIAVKYIADNCRAAYCLKMSGGKIVVNHNLSSQLLKVSYRMAADIPGAARNKYCHINFSF